MDWDDEICRFSFEELELFTDEFSETNFIGNTQFGKVYRGKILKDGMEAQEVTVKIWVDHGIYDHGIYKVQPFQMRRMLDEVNLLGKVKRIPNMVKLMGFCHGEKYGVVYDLKPLDTVYNLVLEDGFSWVQRMKVAVGFACFLASFRSMFVLNYLVRNISPAHIMLDQDYWPILFDFGMLAAGPVSDRSRPTKLSGCNGYFDPCLARPGRWSQKCDVFSLGCVLIGLIAKRLYREEDYSSDAPKLYDWALQTYNDSKKPNCSLVHKSLMADEDFFASDGRKITKLLIRCVDNKHIASRPTLLEVAESLLKLRIVQKHPDLVGIKHILQFTPDEGYFVEY